MANWDLQEVEDTVGDFIKTFDAAISDLHLFLPAIEENDQFPPKIKAIIAPLTWSVEEFYLDFLFEDKLIEEAKKMWRIFWIY